MAASIETSFSAESGLVEDIGGVTISMRGYYAFSYRRFLHAASPYTPDAIVEMGFLTNEAERRELVGDPGYWAYLVMRGLESFVATEDRARVEDFRPGS